MADELQLLRSYARRASIALSNLAGGGSEMFARIGKDFYAEPELCRQRIEDKMSRAWRLRTQSTDSWQSEGGE